MSDMIKKPVARSAAQTKAISDYPELSFLQIAGMAVGGYLAYKMADEQGKSGGEKTGLIIAGVFLGAILGNVAYYTVWTWVSDFFGGLFPWLTTPPVV